MGRKTARYNDFDFALQLTALPMDRSTNEQAKTRMALNMEANIRKSAAGLGHGQYLKPEEVAMLRNGRVMLSANVAGRSYNVPIDISPDGEMSCSAFRSKFGSLREISAKVMDRLFEENGIDNAYRGGHVGIAPRPSQPAFGMRM